MFRWSFDPDPQEITPLREAYAPRKPDNWDELTPRQKSAFHEANYRRRKGKEFHAMRRANEARPENRAKKRRKMAEYRAKNRAILRAKYKSYYEENKHLIGLATAMGRKIRKRTDPEYNLTCALRSRVSGAVKWIKGGKLDKTMDLIGCPVSLLKRHLEMLWEPGMSWSNYGLFGWHIDHIKPCSLFDLTNEEEQRQCFHWTNLQPLWWQDNMEKGTSY